MLSIVSDTLNPFGSSKGIFYLKHILLLILFIPHPALSQARLLVKEPKKNFGYVNRGELVKMDYEISNDGNQPLVLQDAEVACSCTSVDLPKQPIAPGDSAVIHVRFNTITVYGRQDRIVILKSNDPGKATLLRFKGQVSKK